VFLLIFDLKSNFNTILVITICWESHSQRSTLGTCNVCVLRGEGLLLLTLEGPLILYI
jgi:hypothetical protein